MYEELTTDQKTEQTEQTELSQLKQMFLEMKKKQAQLEAELQCEREARCQLESELQHEKVTRGQLAGEVKSEIKAIWQQIKSLQPQHDVAVSVNAETVSSVVLEPSAPLVMDDQPVSEVGELEASKEVNNLNEGAVVSDPHEQAWLGYRFLYGIQCKKDRSKAEYWLCLAKANLDTPPGQWAKGLCYDEGLGENHNKNEALKWYRCAAEKGYKEAQSSVGMHYYCVERQWRNQDEARAWFGLSAHQGCMRGQYYLGVLYREGFWIGDGFERDYIKSKQWFRLSADQGYFLAQCALGKMYYEIINDKEEASKWFHLAADQEEREAQYYLGCIYEDKKYKEHDLNEAVKWYHLSADQGYEAAQQRLIKLTKAGKIDDWEPGVKFWSPKHGSFIRFFSLRQKLIETATEEETKKEAETKTAETGNDIDYIRELAKSGDVDLQALLGYMYLYNLGGVLADKSEAIYWLSLVAAQNPNSPAGQWAQGLSYATGIGVVKNEQTAAQHYKRAAKENYPPAQYSLGLCYQYGNGVSKDSKEAEKYFQLAAQQGNTEAQLALHKESCLIM